VIEADWKPYTAALIETGSISIPTTCARSLRRMATAVLTGEKIYVP
jgi:hypothetical protein